MQQDSKEAASAQKALEVMVPLAKGDPRKLAALSVMALANGAQERAYALARDARDLAPDDLEIRSMTQGPLAAGVPKWHFAIVRDEARNVAYEAALKRAVGPDTLVLDIGAGTGLLALLAARAGAGAVVTCEMNPAVADAAADIVALNGYAHRVRVVLKRSTDLDPEADMGGRADVLVSEIVSNDLLAEYALPVMEDTIARLLKPGAKIIPSSGRIRVALAYWEGLAKRRLGDIAGFDVSPMNRLDRVPRPLKAGDTGLALRGPAADLFDFDFTSGGPYRPGKASLELVADGGPVNGVAQWIHLQLDEEGDYENRPSAGAKSCWAVLFYPLERERDLMPGEAVAVHGAHSMEAVRVWAE